MEFTGNYNLCGDCNHIYDFNDVCPECSSNDIQDINSNEVKEFIGKGNVKEDIRLKTMLIRHDDYVLKPLTVLGK